MLATEALRCFQMQAAVALSFSGGKDQGPVVAVQKAWSLQQLLEIFGFQQKLQIKVVEVNYSFI